MKLYMRIIFSIVLAAGLFVVSCKKSDSPYYDYQNTQQTFDGTALAYLQAQPEGTFDSLLFVLRRYPNLEDSLINREVTVFAPVNENFQSALKYLNIERESEGKPAIYLADIDELQLDTMICKYIIRGKMSSDAYQVDLDGLSVISIKNNYPMHVAYLSESSAGFVGGGPSRLNFSDKFHSNFSKDWVTTRANTVNILTHNAVINILTPIHNFGFDEFTWRSNDPIIK